MNRITWLGLLVALVGIALGSDVVVLTDKNFDDVMTKEELVLVKFYAPWCGHCKSMAKAFEEAATALKGKAVLADVDATVEKKLSERFEIQGFPTLKIFSKGEVVQEYKGGRDKKSMISFMEKAGEPPFVDLADAPAAKKFSEENAAKVRVYGVGLDEESLGKFKKSIFALTDSVGEYAAFAAAKDVTVISSVIPEGTKVDAGDCVLVQVEDGKDVASILEKDATQPTLVDWVKAAAMPAFGFLSPSNAQMYVEQKLPLVVYFSDDEKIDAAVETVFNTVAKSLKTKITGKVNLVWVDKQLESFRKHVGLEDVKPAICIYDFDGDMKYHFPEKTLTEDALSKFLTQYVDGELKPIVKSEPIPKTNDGPVKVVVADSWDSIVMDTEKDVLIEMYAPWCGHCKNLEPIYNDLGAALKDVNTVVIAKMDATANDAPPEHKPAGFPSIKFFPAGEKKAVDYNGPRTKGGFIAFLKKEATHKFEYELSDEELKEGDDNQGGDEEVDEGDDDDDDDDDDDGGEDEDYDEDGEGEDDEEEDDGEDDEEEL